MGSFLNKNRLKIIVSSIFILSFFSPASILGAGYQEKKLFDGDFYTTEDLTRKIKTHNREIQVLDKQIIALKTDIDWLVLKINQIQDSGRTAGRSLKKSITTKEKIINTFLKSKNRLESLVEYYSSMLDPERDQTLEKILRQKIPEPKTGKTSPEQQKAKTAVKR